jgi:hypothetical protein
MYHQQQPFGVPLYSTPSPMRAAAPMQRPGFGVPLYSTPVPQLPWGPAAAVRSPAGTIVAPAGTIRSGGSRWLGGPDARPFDLSFTRRSFGATDTLGGKAWWLAGTVAMGALAYHGYKRNNSIGWALVWGLLGGIIWPITVPVALAQGYGKPAR